MTLTEFLKQRLDEDEAVANRAFDGWTVGGLWNGSGQDPVMSRRRLLAEVEARRRIVECFADLAEAAENPRAPTEFWTGGADGVGDVLRLLALPYADHPDYDEAWRP